MAGKFGDRIRSPSASASNEDSVTVSSAPLPVIPAPSPLTVTTPIRSQYLPIDTIRSQSSPIDTIRSQSVRASDFEDANDSSSYSDSGATSDSVVNENTDLAPTKASASEQGNNFGPTPNYAPPTVPSYGGPSIVRGDHGPPSGYIPNYAHLYNQHQANTPSYYQPSASAHSSHPSSASAHSENDLYPGAPAFMKDLLNAFETLRSQAVPQPTAGTHQVASNQESGQQVASSRAGNLASPTASSSRTISNPPVAPSSPITRTVNQDANQRIKNDRVGNNGLNEHAPSFNENAPSFGPDENFDPFAFFTTNHKPITSSDHAHAHYEGDGNQNHGPHSTHAHMDHNHDHNYHRLPSHAGPYYNPPPPPPPPPAPDFFKALVASNHQSKQNNGHAQKNTHAQNNAHAQNGNQRNQGNGNNRRNGESLYNQASNNLGHPSGYSGRSGHAQTHSHDHGQNHGHGHNHGHSNGGHGPSEHAYKLPEGIPDPSKDNRAKIIQENVGSENSDGKPWGSKMQYLYRDPKQPNNYMEVTEGMRRSPRWEW